MLWRKGTEAWWRAAVGGHGPGKSAWGRGRRFETQRTEIIAMGKLWKGHCRQKEEQMQKPSDGEGSDTSKKMKVGQRLEAQGLGRKEARATAREGGGGLLPWIWQQGLAGQGWSGSPAAVLAADGDMGDAALGCSSKQSSNSHSTIFDCKKANQGDLTEGGSFSDREHFCLIQWISDVYRRPNTMHRSRENTNAPTTWETMEIRRSCSRSPCHQGDEPRSSFPLGVSHSSPADLRKN